MSVTVVKAQHFVYPLKTENLSEISGIISVTEKISDTLEQEFLWCLGDGGSKAKLYKIQVFDSNYRAYSGTKAILPEFAITHPIDSTEFDNASNIDWEDLSRDDSFVYIGDFGNNNGTRKNLVIYKFKLSDLGKKNVHADTLSFNYGVQNNFSSRIFHNFDCEAMTVIKDSIYLFTKGQGNGYSYVYGLKKQAGNYTLWPIDSFYTTHLITGAASSETEKMWWLVGYKYNSSLKLQSGICSATIGKKFDNFWFNTAYGKTQSGIDYQSNSQTEAIAFGNNPNVKLILAAETVDTFLAHVYFYNSTNNLDYFVPSVPAIIYPNPGVNLTVKSNVEATLAIFNDRGQLVHQQFIFAGVNYVSTIEFARGTYLITIYAPNYSAFKKQWVKDN